MTTQQRTDLGFGAELDTFDPKAWAPNKPKNANDRPPKERVKQAAQESGFRSREPQALPEPRPEPVLEKSVPEKIEARAGEGSAPRRRRTGRNAQFNLKARPETIEAFCAIADRQGWGLGETLERAVAALEKDYPAEK